MTISGDSKGQMSMPLMFSAGDSHARISALRGSVRDWLESGAGAVYTKGVMPDGAVRGPCDRARRIEAGLIRALAVVLVAAGIAAVGAEKAGFRGPEHEESETAMAFAEVRDGGREGVLVLPASQALPGGPVQAAVVTGGVDVPGVQVPVRADRADDDQQSLPAAVYNVIVPRLSRDGTPVPPTPTVVPTPVGRSIEAVICSVPWPCGEALAVARCESGLNPAAHNRGSDARGLFQLLWRYHAWRFAGGDPFDPETNVRAAFGLWQERGWQPWIVGGCRPW